MRFKPPRGTRAWIRAWFASLRVAARSLKWWVTNLFVLLFWVAFGIPVYEKGKAYGILHTAFAILLVSGRAWRHGGPRAIQVVDYEYQTRKNRLYALISQMQFRTEMSPREIEEFQRDALKLIASYVRGYLEDPKARKIFVSLLVEDGDHLKVLARDSDQRLPGARYPKDAMVGWDAIRTGEMAVASDVREIEDVDFTGKKYRSIMALPVLGAGRVLGAVSIDSAESHVFDRDCDKLQEFLAPYVCLLAWTLIGRAVQCQESGTPDGGGAHEQHGDA